VAQRLSTEQLSELREELRSLNKQQDDSKELQMFVSPSKKEAADYEARQERISHIHVILSEHDIRR
jgi:hypothetical protein